jgi:hypothetical protein
MREWIPGGPGYSPDPRAPTPAAAVSSYGDAAVPAIFGLAMTSRSGESSSLGLLGECVLRKNPALTGSAICREPGYFEDELTVLYLCEVLQLVWRARLCTCRREHAQAPAQLFQSRAKLPPRARQGQHARDLRVTVDSPQTVACMLG